MSDKEIKTKCLCSKCPIEEQCMENEITVHDKLGADLEAAQDKLRRIKRIISVFSLQRPYRQVNQIYEILEDKP